MGLGGAEAARGLAVGAVAMELGQSGGGGYHAGRARPAGTFEVPVIFGARKI